jgi:hypothetical protein
MKDLYRANKKYMKYIYSWEITKGRAKIHVLGDTAYVDQVQMSLWVHIHYIRIFCKWMVNAM